MYKYKLKIIKVSSISNIIKLFNKAIAYTPHPGIVKSYNLIV